MFKSLILKNSSWLDGFKPSRGDGVLRATKIRSTPSFGREVKLEVPRRKILRHVKDPLTHLKY
jgi:hypothetical protein